MSSAAYQSVAVNECCFLLCLLLFGTSIRQTTQLVAALLLWRPCSSRARSRVYIYVNYCIPTEHDLLFRVSRPSLFAEGLARETTRLYCERGALPRATLASLAIIWWHCFRIAGDSTSLVPVPGPHKRGPGGIHWLRTRQKCVGIARKLRGHDKVLITGVASEYSWKFTRDVEMENSRSSRFTAMPATVLCLAHSWPAVHRAVLLRHT